MAGADLEGVEELAGHGGVGGGVETGRGFGGGGRVETWGGLGEGLWGWGESDDGREGRDGGDFM